MSWNQTSLVELLKGNKEWAVEAEGDCVSISNEEGIHAFAYAGESQLIIESILFPKAQVEDVNALNNLILSTHQLLPLSTVCTQSIDGEEYYIAFGSLSVNSKDVVVIEEVETLFDNVCEFLELYSQHIKQESAA